MIMASERTELVATNFETEFLKLKNYIIMWLNFNRQYIKSSKRYNLVNGMKIETL